MSTDLVEHEKQTLEYYKSLVDAYGELKYIIGGEETTQFCFDFAVHREIIVYQVVPYAEHFVEEGTICIATKSNPPSSFIAQYFMVLIQDLTKEEITDCIDTMRRWVKDIDAALNIKTTPPACIRCEAQLEWDEEALCSYCVQVTR